MSLTDKLNEMLKTVKEYNLANDEPARNEDIAAMLGYKRTYFSGLLSGQRNVTQDHIKNMELNFPHLFKKETLRAGPKEDQDTDEKITLSLIREMMANTTKLINQNDVAVNSIAKLVDTNALQARMLDRKIEIPADVPKQIPLSDQSILAGIQEALIQVSLGKRFQSKSEAAVEIRRLIVGTPESKKLSIRKSAHK